MSWLLDGNALVALILDGHVHHDDAVRWFSARARRRFATCVITQGTLLRLHMTMAEEQSAAAAWQTLRAVVAHPRHDYWDDGFGYGAVPHRHLQGRKQVTDAWLAELARKRGGKVATFDRGFAALHDDVAELIRVQ